MNDVQSYERILRDLQEMRTEIEDNVRPIARQVVAAEVDQLVRLSEQYQKSLSDCLVRLDNSIIECQGYWTEFERTRAGLKALNERLSSLGAKPDELEELRSGSGLAALVVERLQALQDKGGH